MCKFLRFYVIADISELLHPDDLSEALESYAVMKAGVRSGTPAICQVTEERLRHKDGSWRILEVIAKVLDTPSGAGVVLNSRDITERKRTEEALRSSEELYRVLFERNVAGIGQMSLDGRILDCNGAFARIFGYASRDELLSRRVSDLWFDPAEREALVARIQGEVALSNVELRLRRKDGQAVWVLENLSMVKRGEGQDPIIEATVVDITERRRAEEALKKSTQLLRDTGEMAKVGGWELDLSTKEVSWTEEVGRIHGVGPGYEPTLEEALNFYAPESRPALEEALKKAAETGEPHDLESLFIPSGSKDKIWVRSLGRAVISGGKIVKLAGTFQNIDKYKRAEEALRESEQFNREVIANVQEGVAVYDREFRYQLWNRFMEELTGVPASQVLGKHAFDLFPHLREQKLDLMIRRALAGEIVDTPDTPFRVPTTGKFGWVSNTYGPHFGARGEIIGVIGTIRDITERRRTEEALRDSEKQSRTLFESANDAILIFEPENEIILDANKKACEAYGFSKEQLVGTSLKKLTKDVPRGERQIAEILRDGSYLNFETVHSNKDGSPIDILASSSVIDHGGQRAILAILRDITERKRTEEALRNLSGRLLRLQDEERRRIARELHDTTAQSLAGLAINLSVVKDSAPNLSLRASACLSESLELAEQCSREIRTLSYLLHPPLVDEAGLAPALQWYTAGFAQRSGIEVHEDVSPEFGRLPSDLELTLYRIVQEALTNVHRHSGSKTARIWLQRRPKEIVLTVADEGHGFPSAALGIAGPEGADIGVGIPGMRERLRQLGGRLHIQTGSPGTTLTAILPLGQVTNGQITLPFGG